MNREEMTAERHSHQEADFVQSYGWMMASVKLRGAVRLAREAALVLDGWDADAAEDVRRAAFLLADVATVVQDVQR